jgi:hypothetical protein
MVKVGAAKWTGSTLGLLALGQQALIAAANQGAEIARNLAPRDTGQLAINIHTILPGMDDMGTGVVESTGISAGPTEAYIIAKTHRKPGGSTPRDRGDYAYFQEFGPASQEDPNGRHYMQLAAEAIRGNYSMVNVGNPVGADSVGGKTV